MQIQEYNLHIQHTKGADNFFADMISRNPVVLCERDTKELMVAAINLGIDDSVEKSLRDLTVFQAQDNRIKKLI
jgi:hypothetical protein